jgi:hypothetical protein
MSEPIFTVAFDEDYDGYYFMDIYQEDIDDEIYRQYLVKKLIDKTAILVNYDIPITEDSIGKKVYGLYLEELEKNRLKEAKKKEASKKGWETRRKKCQQQ